MLAHLRARDVDIITMDELHRRLDARDFSRRFACFTLDDGYRDNRDHALPVLREFDAPCIVYAVSDFAAGKGRLWWVALERVVAGAAAIEVEMDGRKTHLQAGTPAQKEAAFDLLHDWLRALPSEHDVAREMSALCARHGVDEAAICRRTLHVLGRAEILRRRSAGDDRRAHHHPLPTSPSRARRSRCASCATSRADIEAAIGRKVEHLAYPYGDRIAAGPREFALARTAGFKTAVTTRPGMTYPGSADHMTALQRVSLNGHYQDERILPVLTSGSATALWNGFRLVDAD